MNQKNQQPTGYRLYTFTKVNFLILLISLIVIIIGYLLMSGGSSANGVSFNPKVFSFTRITVAPMLCTVGYLGVLVAILYRSRNSQAVCSDDQEK